MMHDVFCSAQSRLARAHACRQIHTPRHKSSQCKHPSQRRTQTNSFHLSPIFAGFPLVHRNSVQPLINVRPLPAPPTSPRTHAGLQLHTNAFCRTCGPSLLGATRSPSYTYSRSTASPTLPQNTCMHAIAHICTLPYLRAIFAGFPLVRRHQIQPLIHVQPLARLAHFAAEHAHRRAAGHALHQCCIVWRGVLLVFYLNAKQPDSGARSSGSIL